MGVQIATVDSVGVNPLVDRFVADTHLLVVGIISNESSGDLLWRPVIDEFAMNIVHYLALRFFAPVVGFSFSLIGILLSCIIPVNSIIGIGGPVALDLPTDGAVISANAPTDLTQT
jgi:hypothetical protein